MEIVDSSQKVHAELMNIRVDRIRRNKEQPRKKFHRGDLLILGLSLKDQGQTDRVEVIRVYGDPDADFELVKGERRWRAAQLVGMVELRAIISPPSEIPNKDVQHRVCLISDSHHSKYSDVEIAFALARERAKGNYTLQQLATMCKKKSSAWVAQHLAITNLHPELLKLLNPDLPRPKQMSFAIAWRIARLTPVEQLDVYDKVSRIKGAKLQLIEVEKLVSSKHPKEARKKSSADYYKNLGIMVPRMLADASMAEGFPSESFLSLIKHRPHDEVEQIIKRIDETVQHLRTLKSRIVDARESWERCTRV
jgi:ParB family chromosome partitioning protein